MLNKQLFIGRRKFDMLLDGSDMKSSALILIAHGSKDPRWREPFEKLEKGLKADLGEGGVYLAYMECAQPTLMDAVKKAVENGAKKIKILPLFLAGGAHIENDIAPKVSNIRKKFSDLEVKLLEPIGEHPEFEKLIYRIAIESV